MNYDTPISPTILIFYNFQNTFENISRMSIWIDQTESNKKITFNEHPKLIQKGFQEKVKQTKEKIIGN